MSGRCLIRHYRWLSLLVLLYVAANVLVGLGSTTIKSYDEARYGVAAAEMLRAGTWLIPTYAHQPEYWNLKPPVGYWPIIASFKIFGISAWSLRLPSAIASIATIWLLMRWCARRCGRRVALLAGLIGATSHGFLTDHGARSGDLDAMLTWCATALLVLLPRYSWSTLAAGGCGLMIGLAMLIKSFAILPFAVAIALWCLWSGSWRSMCWRHMALIGGIPLAMFGAWAAQRTWADGSTDFVMCMMNEDFIGRIGTAVDESTGPWYDYLRQLLDSLAPWPEIAIVCLFPWYIPRKRKWPPAVAPLLIWVGVSLVLCSSMTTHHQWYIYPMLPALIAVIAWCMVRTADQIGPIALAVILAAMVTCGLSHIPDRPMPLSPGHPA